MRKNHHGLLLQEDGSWLLWLGEHLFSPSQFTSAARLLATSEGLLSRFYGDFPEQMSQVASTATNDVDVLLIDVDDPTTSPLYQPFKVAVRAVANRNRLPVTWMNDLLGEFLRDTTKVPRGTLWRTYALLAVYVPEAEYILALKLLAGRPKERGDLQLLCQSLHVGTP